MNIQDVSNELSKKGVEHSQTGDPESIGMKGVPQIVLNTDSNQIIPDRGDLLELNFEDIESVGICESVICDDPIYLIATRCFDIRFEFYAGVNCKIAITAKCLAGGGSGEIK